MDKRCSLAMLCALAWGVHGIAGEAPREWRQHYTAGHYAMTRIARSSDTSDETIVLMLTPSFLEDIEILQSSGVFPLQPNRLEPY